MNERIKPIFKQINLLFFALLGGIFVTFLAFFTVKDGLAAQYAAMNLEWLVYAAPLSGLAVIFLSNMIYRGKTTKAAEMPDLANKIQEYRISVVLRMVILDFAAILNLFCFGITGNFLFAGLAMIVFVLFFLYRPSVDQMILDLRLSEQEIAIVTDTSSK